MFISFVLVVLVYIEILVWYMYCITCDLSARLVQDLYQPHVCTLNIKLDANLRTKIRNTEK